MFGSWKLVAAAIGVTLLAVMGLRWQAGIAAVAKLEAAYERERVQAMRSKMKDRNHVRTISDADLASSITRRRPR